MEFHVRKEPVTVDGAREVDAVEDQFQLGAVERILVGKHPAVRLGLLLDESLDERLGIAAVEGLHGLPGGFDTARGEEIARLLQVRVRVLEEGLLRRIAVEAVDLAVLVGPGDGALGHDVTTLRKRLGALSAELHLRGWRLHR